MSLIENINSYYTRHEELKQETIANQVLLLKGVLQMGEKMGAEYINFKIHYDLVGVERYFLTEVSVETEDTPPLVLMQGEMENLKALNINCESGKYGRYLVSELLEVMSQSSKSDYLSQAFGETPIEFDGIVEIEDGIKIKTNPKNITFVCDAILKTFDITPEFFAKMIARDVSEKEKSKLDTSINKIKKSNSQDPTYKL